MSDLLVHLLKLPPLEPLTTPLAEQGLVIRRARAFELSIVQRFARAHFGEDWSDEATVAFAHQPIGCYLAAHAGVVVGFACIDATARGYFGPTGVDPAYRKRGLGKALLVAALHGLRELGFVYGIIGGADPIDFYTKHGGAVLIPDSRIGIYGDLLKRDRGV